MITPSGPDRHSSPLTGQERREFVDRLLAWLPGPADPPTSTRQIGDSFALGPYERSALLWTELDRLARAGLVERVVEPGQTVRYWRRTAEGDQQVQARHPHRSPSS